MYIHIYTTNSIVYFEVIFMNCMFQKLYNRLLRSITLYYPKEVNEG